MRLQHASLNHAKRARARPGHAFQKPSAVDSIIIMVVLNDAAWVRIEQVLFRHSRFLRFRDCSPPQQLDTGDATTTGSGWILARVACQDVLHLHKPESVRFYSIGITFSCTALRE